MTRPIILDLCGGTGSWSRPYAESDAYDVRVIDVGEWVGDGGIDVRLFEYTGEPVRGILAAPPCTHLASSGARWWASKGKGALLESLSIADACMRIVAVHRPQWWALENPVGRLRRFYGPPALTFNPCDYGDPYTKRTLVWGHFNLPRTSPVEPTEGSKMWAQYGGKSDRTKRARSVTPQGFARAFFEANP